MPDDGCVHPGRDFCNVVEIILCQGLEIAAVTLGKKVGDILGAKVDGTESALGLNHVDGANDVLIRRCRMVGQQLLLNAKVDVYPAAVLVLQGQR